MMRALRPWEVGRNRRLELMTVPEPSTAGRAELARRLGKLRLHHWDAVVPQRVLAEALGGDAKPLAQSLISGGEQGRVVPPPRRLREIATFYATPRSMTGERARLLLEDELTADELRARDELLDELTALRDGSDQRAEAAGAATIRSEGPVLEAGGGASLRFDWAFPGGAPVRIVCGKLDDPPEQYTNPENLNYTDLLTYADLDSLVELHGHIRKVNPETDVRFRRSDRLAGADSADELASHLVLLGGIGLNALTDRMLAASGLPIRQDEDPAFSTEGEIFEVTDDKEKIKFLPTLSDGKLVEDVGLIARTPNPLNSSTTLTLCNGVFARGVLGAVRTLTDDNLRKQNESWLAERFGGATRFAILVRVPVVLDNAQTPDLTTEAMRLYEWCDQR
jgi:hypothetical protein